MKKRAMSKIKRKNVVSVCSFCKDNKTINFIEIDIIKRYVTERGKIINRLRSGVCAKHQRRLSLAIKYARYLALLPYSGQL